jgi:acetyl-CoA acetyltransferase
VTTPWIIGVGQTPFDRHPGRTVADLALEAIAGAARDAEVSLESVDAVFFANSLQGYHEDQHCIRGQVALQRTALEGKPIVNVENACASGSTALHLATLAVRAGQYRRVLAVGVDKLAVADPARMFGAFGTAVDVAHREQQIGVLLRMREDRLAALRRERPDLGCQIPAEGTGGNRTVFMDIYAAFAAWHMARYGSTPEAMAAIAAKNHRHGALNPNAQIRIEMTADEVLRDRIVSWPLTRAMCSPIGDGAAAAILEAGSGPRSPSRRAVRVRASALACGTHRPVDAVADDVAARAARAAYAEGGIAPRDVDVAEVHDATAFGELHQVEALGFAPEGEGAAFALADEGALGGRLPINPSGGLECRGHPIGATGLAQVFELVLQLRGEAGRRQVEGARMALAENGGGNLEFEEAAVCVHLLEAGHG